MLYSPFPPSDIIYPDQAPRRIGSNAYYLPFRGHPGGCYVRPRPHAVHARPNPTYCRYHNYPSHVLSSGLGLAGNLVDSLMAKKLASGHQSHSQQKHKQVPADAHQMSRMTLAAASMKAEKERSEGQKEETCTSATETSCKGKQQGCCKQEKTGCCTGKEGKCCSSTLGNATSSRNGSSSQVWMQPVSLQGFAPDEVKVHVAEGMVHIHAKTEKLSGPGPCLSRYEMMRTVKLPADVDQQAVSCVMVPNGNLIVYAPRMSQQALIEKNEDPASVEDQTSGRKEGEGEKKEKSTEQETTTQSEQQAPQEQKMETSAELKDDSVEKNDFAKLAEKMTSQPEEQPACEEMPASTSASEPASAAPRRLGEMAEETLEKAEASKNPKLNLTTESAVIEEAEDDMPLSPTASEIEESVKWLFGDDDCCCCMDEDDYEILSSGSLSNVSSSDAGRETNGDMTEQEVGAVETPENVREENEMGMEQENSPPKEENSSVPYTSQEKNQSDPEAPPTTEENHVPEASVMLETPAEHECETENAQKDSDTDSKLPECDETVKKPQAEMDTDPTPPIKWPQMDEQPTDPNTLSSENKPPKSADNAEPFCALIPLKEYRPQDLQVKLQDHSLTVTAEREGRLGGMVFTDSTQRKLQLPEYIDVSSVRCVLREDGMLVITAVPTKQE